MFDGAEDPAPSRSSLPFHRGAEMAWVRTAAGAPYFVTDDGEPWTPIGYNDSINWAELRPLYARRDLAAVERHLRYVKANGATCIRLMLECLHGHNRLIESPLGVFRPRMVRLWDDLFALCAKVGLRVLLTPFDTFWTWIHWRRHPLNVANGGPLHSPARMLLDPDAREAIKARLSFAVRRWGGSGALFAWDLWNEIHPAQAEDSAEPFMAFIADLSQHVRRLELSLYGRSHPQTVSLFGPELSGRPDMPIAEPIFRHPDLDFASIHIYAHGTIDDPADTVAPAVDMGRITAECLRETPPDRPFLDTEHGPIHTFKDRKKTLERRFDEEMFRHMQWAHLASGGAGGGMRWPNRRPHRLTPGMHRAQGALARFLPLIDWPRFRRRNVSDTLEAEVRDGAAAAFACADERQAVIYLLRRDALDARGRVAPDGPVHALVRVPGLGAGAHRVTAVDPGTGEVVHGQTVEGGGGGLAFDTPPWRAELVLAVTPAA